MRRREGPGHRRVEPDRAELAESLAPGRRGALLPARTRRRAEACRRRAVVGDVRDADAVARRRRVRRRRAPRRQGRRGGGVGGVPVGQRRRHGQRARAAAPPASQVVHVSSPSVAHGGDPIVGGAPTAGRSAAATRGTPSRRRSPRRWRSPADDGSASSPIRPHLVWGPGDTQLVGRIVERAEPAGSRSSAAAGRWSTRPTSTTRSTRCRRARRVGPGAVLGPGLRDRQRRAAPDPRAGRRHLPGGRRAVRAARRAAARRCDRLGRRAVWPRARPRRRAAADPVRRRAARHRPLVRPPPGARRSRLAPTVAIDEGLERLAAWYRRADVRRLAAAARRYPRAVGDVAEWLRQRPAKPCTRVRFPASPPTPEQV